MLEKRSTCLLDRCLFVTLVETIGIEPTTF